MHEGGRRGGAEVVEDPQRVQGGFDLTGLGEFQGLLVGVTGVLPRGGRGAPVTPQTRGPRFRAAVERLAAQPGAGEYRSSSPRAGAAPAGSVCASSTSRMARACSGCPLSQAHSR